MQVVVLLFPVLSALTSFPLLSLSFCNSLARLRHWAAQGKPLHAESALAATAAAVVHSRWFTLAAVTPSLLLAAVRGRLDSIFFFTAPLSFLLQLVLPCVALLAVYRQADAAGSRRAGEAEGQSAWGSLLFRPAVVWLLLAAGCLLLLLTLALILVVAL